MHGLLRVSSAQQHYVQGSDIPSAFLVVIIVEFYQNELVELCYAVTPVQVVRREDASMII